MKLTVEGNSQEIKGVFGDAIMNQSINQMSPEEYSKKIAGAFGVKDSHVELKEDDAKAPLKRDLNGIISRLKTVDFSNPKDAKDTLLSSSAELTSLSNKQLTMNSIKDNINRACHKVERIEKSDDPKQLIANILNLLGSAHCDAKSISENNLAETIDGVLNRILGMDVRKRDDTNQRIHSALCLLYTIHGDAS